MSQYTTLLPEAPFSFSSVDQYSSHLHHHQEEDSLSKVTTTSAVSLAFTASASVAFKTFFGVLVHTPSIRNKSTASLLLGFFRRVGNGCLQAHCHNVWQHLLCYHQTKHSVSSSSIPKMHCNERETLSPNRLGLISWT